MNQNIKRHVPLFVLLLLQVPLLSSIMALASKLFPALLTLKLNSFGDFRQQVLCVYTVHGINPYAPTEVLPDIGPITEGFATSPWGLTLGNIFYPAFIPIEYGCLYMTLFSLIMLWITCFILVGYFKPLWKDYDACIIWTSALLFTSASMWMSILNRNASCIIACLIIMSIIYSDSKPLMSGILLGFAMIKPQMCGLVCLIFLFEKKIKPLIIAAAIDICGYITTCTLLKEDPITLFIQFMNSDVGVVKGDAEPYYGIFSFLIPYGVDNSIITICSAVVGIATTSISYALLKKKNIENSRIKTLLLFSPALICSHIWAYGWNLDKGTLVPVVVFLASIFIHVDKMKTVSLLGYGAAMLAPSAYYVIHKALHRVSYWSGMAGGICAFASLIAIMILFNNHTFINELNEKFPKENQNAVS